MTTVEAAAYKLPQNQALNHYSYLGDKVEQRVNISTSGEEFGSSRIQDHGFNYRPLDEMASERGTWHIFDRFGYPIPSFPDGEITTQAMVGIYDKGRSDVNVILRISTEPFEPAQFKDDLNAFAKYFIDRGSGLKLPSRLVSTGRKYLFGAFAFGATYSSALLAAASSPEDRVIGAALGLWLGFGVTVVVGSSLFKISENIAKGKISDPRQYLAGDNVASYLKAERDHVNNALVEREVYEALRSEDADITPETFLSKIYGNIPAPLVQARIREMAITKVSNQQQEPSVIVPEIVQVAKYLQAIA